METGLLKQESDPTSLHGRTVCQLAMSGAMTWTVDCSKKLGMQSAGDDLEGNEQTTSSTVTSVSSSSELGPRLLTYVKRRCTRQMSTNGVRNLLQLLLEKLVECFTHFDRILYVYKTGGRSPVWSSYLLRHTPYCCLHGLIIIIYLFIKHIHIDGRKQEQGNKVHTVR